MSKVISFRLNMENARQRIAWEVIDQKRNEGMSIREVIIKALIQLDQANDVTEEEIDTQLIRKTLTRVNLLLANIELEGQSIQSDPEPDPSVLASDFISSVKCSVKPGIRLD
jgi:hypothetical protein